MSSIVENSHTAEWQQLVSEAKQIAQSPLNEELESYLVFMLMRYVSRPEMASKCLAVEYLDSLQRQGSHQEISLRDVGDQCLLFTGLFPQRMVRRQVTISYYVDLGRSAYQHLADTLTHSMATLYQDLAISFITVMDILLALRNIDANNHQQLDAVMAYELWQQTHSQHSYRVLNHYGVRPMELSRKPKHKKH